MGWLAYLLVITLQIRYRITPAPLLLRRVKLRRVSNLVTRLPVVSGSPDIRS